MFRTGKGIILASLIYLGGCSGLGWYDSNNTVDNIKIHPELPKQIELKPVEWEVIENEDGSITIRTDYQSFLTHIENTADVARYLKQLISALCYYRSDLNEDICTIELTNGEKSIKLWSSAIK